MTAYLKALDRLSDAVRTLLEEHDAVGIPLPKSMGIILRNVVATMENFK